MLDLTTLSTVELRSLTKAMHEARFPDSYNDPIVWCAPLVIDLHVACIEEDYRRLVESGDERGLAGLQKWRQWRGRPERQVFISRLNEDERFRRVIVEGGSDYVREILRPFLLGDESARSLVEYAARLDETDEA